VREALALLATLDKKWFLLVDGTDELEALSGLWPLGHSGDVLYTSQNEHLRSL
jgi:hypothetical protein